MSKSFAQPQARPVPEAALDELRTLLAALRRFTKLTPMNTISARQRIADVLIKANKYTY